MLFCLLSSINGFADESNTVIQLKNGTTIVGKLKSVNSDKAVIEISGVTAEIPFPEIAEIRGDDQEEIRYEKMNSDYCVLDEQDYPETLTLTIGVVTKIFKKTFTPLVKPGRILRINS